MKPSSPLLLLLGLLVGFLMSGCLLAGASAPPPSTEVAATSVIYITTTPLPSATPTTTPTVTLTPKPSPTANRTATAAAKVTAIAEAINELIAPDLEAYGVVPSDGHMVWVEEKTINLDLTNYLENQNHLMDEAGELTDFVIQSRVTWKTSGALSLCGITFDIDKADTELGKQSRFFMMRLQFAPLWTVQRWEYGKFKNFISDDWHTSGNIHDENGSVNLVGLVVRDKNIDVFINHDKQRRFEDSKRTGGLLALSANQESGKTLCRFEETWIWAFDQ